MSVEAIIGLLMAAVVSAIGWLLAAKDKSQERELESVRQDVKDLKEDTGKQITALWAKHDEDAAKLETLQRHIDKEHYLKSELDNKFDRLETTMKNGMDKLSSQFEILSNVLVQHVTREDAREDARDRREREREKASA